MDCLSRSIVAKQPVCYLCNKLSLEGKTCPSCLGKTALSGVVVASYYEGVVKQLVAGLKYEQATDLAVLGAELLVPRIDASHYDLLVPIPVTATHYGFRGYNQAALLARELSTLCHLPVVNALGRLGNTRQVGKSRSERLSQVEGQFYVRYPRLLHGTRILLVDDVITTGATLAEGARALSLAGASSVWGATIAQH